MAEFCKKCFVEKLLSAEDYAKIREGSVQYQVKLSASPDLCEGCGEMKPVVIQARQIKKGEPK